MTGNIGIERLIIGKRREEKNLIGPVVDVILRPLTVVRNKDRNLRSHFCRKFTSDIQKLQGLLTIFRNNPDASHMFSFIR